MNGTALDPRDQWAHEIGRFMLAFGSIEHITHQCLRKLSRECVADTMQFQSLGARIDLMREMLSARDGTPYKKLHQLFGEAKAQSNDRNLIAHNPLVLDFYANNDDEIFLQAKISHARKNHHLTLQELQNRRNKAEKLALALLSAFQEALALQAKKDVG